mmetsp:Transcript_17404/g.28592  ORF Transcript_17404/g.28592 Transcript_17404/m.28592 type:complete len:569 (-) Transcript_17404:23-1729(-)
MFQILCFRAAPQSRHPSQTSDAKCSYIKNRWVTNRVSFERKGEKDVQFVPSRCVSVSASSNEYLSRPGTTDEIEELVRWYLQKYTENGNYIGNKTFEPYLDELFFSPSSSTKKTAKEDANKQRSQFFEIAPAKLPKTESATHFLECEYGLSREELRRMHDSVRDLYEMTRTDLWPVIKRIKQLKLTRKEVKEILMCQPALIIADPLDMEERISYFQAIGLSGASLKEVCKQADLLLLDPHWRVQLKPTINALNRAGVDMSKVTIWSKIVSVMTSKEIDQAALNIRHEFSLSMTQQLRLLRRCPELLLQSAKSISSVGDYLRSFDVPQESLSSIIDQCPALIFAVLDHSLHDRVDFFKSIGIEGSTTLMMCKRENKILSMSTSAMRSRLTFLRSLGFDGASLSFILSRAPQVLLLREQKLRGTMSVLSTYGVSAADIRAAIRRYPPLLAQSLTKLQKAVSFITVQAGYSVDEVLRTPAVLGLSLETRTLPRLLFLKEMRRQTCLSRALCVSDADFATITAKSCPEVYLEFKDCLMRRDVAAKVLDEGLALVDCDWSMDLSSDISFVAQD